MSQLTTPARESPPATVERISACVLTYNEERKIERCLRSLTWCDELVVMDSFSTDGTLEICRRYTDRVFQHAWLGYVGQRNLVREMTTHPWILFLDADEEVSQGLVHEIMDELNSGTPTRYVGFEFPRQVYYIGRWIRHGEWYPDVKLRLFKKSNGRTEGEEPHDHVIVNGPVKRLRNPLYHYTYDDIRDHLDTLNRFSTITAQQKFVQESPFRWADLLLRPPIRFLKGYLVRLGFLDGMHGLIIAMLNSYGVFIKYAKLWELNHKSRGRFDVLPAVFPRPKTPDRTPLTFRALRRRLTFVGLLAVWACGGTAGVAADDSTNAPPSTWTLPAAIDYALAHNRAIEARRLGLESRQVGAAAAADTFRWTLRPVGGAEARDDGRYLDAGLLATRATESGTVLSAGPRYQQTTLDNAPDVNEGRLAIEVRQPLLRRGGTLVNTEPLVRATREVQTARRDLELQRADIVLRVVELHEELFRLQRRLTNDTAAAARMDAFLHLTRARDRQGRAARGDTLRAEIACGTIHQQQADTAARLTARRADLADLLGLPPTVPFDALPGPQFVVTAPAAAEAAAVALSNRLDYAQILQDIDDARRGVRIARQTLLPDFEIASRYERQGQGDTAESGLSLNHNAWMVGVRLLSDFPPRAERRALSQAEITERVARLRADTVQSAIRLQVVQALDVLHRSDGDLSLAGPTVAAARQRLELMRRLYSSARATTFDVADAETQWRDADERWLAARSSVTVAAYRLLWTLGTLTDVPNSLKSGSDPAP